MYQYRNRTLGDAALVTAAVANSVIDILATKKMNKYQARFLKRLESDEVKMEFIRFLVAKLRSTGDRIVQTTNLEPGTPEFETYLTSQMLEDMHYQGNCNAEIFDPTATPRKIIGKFYRTGRIEAPGMPPDTGPIWATGCKNAQDFFRISHLKEQKGSNKFLKVKYQAEDLGTMDLFLRYGLGLLTIAILLIAIRLQRKEK